MWLRQNNFAARCGSMLMDVSTPSSPKYGQHLSMAQLRELVYDAEAVDAVHAFLDKHKVVDRFEAPNGDYISFRAPIATVQNMFRTKFFTFASAQRSHSLNRALSMTIPDEIASFVSTTTGVIDFPMHAHHASIEAFTADSLKRQTRPGVNPALIAKTYAMPNETDSSTKSDIAVFESLGQSYSPADLDKFLQMFNIPAEKLANVIGTRPPLSTVISRSCQDLMIPLSASPTPTTVLKRILVPLRPHIMYSRILTISRCSVPRWCCPRRPCHLLEHSGTPPNLHS